AGAPPPVTAVVTGAAATAGWSGACGPGAASTAAMPATAGLGAASVCGAAALPTSESRSPLPTTMAIAITARATTDPIAAAMSLPRRREGGPALTPSDPAALLKVVTGDPAGAGTGAPSCIREP